MPDRDRPEANRAVRQGVVPAVCPVGSLAVLVAFYGYLRSSEVVGLLVRDVSFLPGGARAILRLRDTKTGRDQAVTLDNGDVVRLLRRRVDSMGSSRLDDPLFGFTSTAQWQSAFRAAVHAAGLHALPYVPHSLRHGGATRDFLKGLAVARIVQRGRWRRVESAMHYIQNGPALLQLQDLPASKLQAGKRALGSLFAVFKVYV